MLRSTGLVVEEINEGSLWYRVVHLVLAEVAYEMLSVIVRRQLHAQLARAVERRRHDDARLLAAHLRAAGHNEAWDVNGAAADRGNRLPHCRPHGAMLAPVQAVRTSWDVSCNAGSRERPRCGGAVHGGPGNGECGSVVFDAGAGIGERLGSGGADPTGGSLVETTRTSVRRERW